MATGDDKKMDLLKVAKAVAELGRASVVQAKWKAEVRAKAEAAANQIEKDRQERWPQRRDRGRDSSEILGLHRDGSKAQCYPARTLATGGYHQRWERR
ncbi:DUF3486 family protein [Pseudomonas qingdaonensis]|nr:DUF3486 family protein [Pseudomonas qingdaonensis]